MLAPGAARKQFYQMREPHSIAYIFNKHTAAADFLINLKGRTSPKYFSSHTFLPPDISKPFLITPLKVVLYVSVLNKEGTSNYLVLKIKK